MVPAAVQVTVARPADVGDQADVRAIEERAVVDHGEGRRRSWAGRRWRATPPRAQTRRFGLMDWPSPEILNSPSGRPVGKTKIVKSTESSTVWPFSAETVSVTVVVVVTVLAVHGIGVSPGNSTGGTSSHCAAVESETAPSARKTTDRSRSR